MLCIIGDIHGDFKKLNALLIRINHIFPSIDTVIQAGDFGYWPRIGSIGHWLNSLIVPDGMTLYWIDGNHEDFDSMAKFGMLAAPGKLKTFKNGKVCYVPRGSVLNLGGYEILFIGGAESIDALHRKQGLDWFSQETITNKDVQNAINSCLNRDIDIVVSHEAPRSFDLYNLNPSAWKNYGWDKWDNPSRDALEQVLQVVKPNRWFFAHYHMSMFGEVENMNWRCLDVAEFYILEDKEGFAQKED